MKYRKRMNKRASKRSFTKGAMRVKKKNYAKVMRGGIRL
jgi:hypothetical protein